MLTEKMLSANFDANLDDAGAKLAADLATRIEAAMDGEKGARHQLLDWLRVRALERTGLEYKGDRPCAARIYQDAGLEKRQWDKRKLEDILDTWAPLFPRAAYRYRAAMRDALPDVRQRGVAVPRNILVAEMRREAEGAKRWGVKLMEHLIAVAEGDRTLPNWNGGPNHNAIYRDAGLAGEMAPGAAQYLGPMINRWAGFFRLAELLTVNRNGEPRVRRVGRVEVEKYVAGLRAEGRRLWRLKNDRIAYNAIATETNLPHTTVTNKQCKDIVQAYQRECVEADGGVGHGLGDVWPGLSLAERQERRARRGVLMDYVRECVGKGIPLPSRRDRRNAIDFAELVRRSGHPGPTLEDDIEFRRQIWQAGAKVDRGTTVAGDAYDYATLLRDVPADRVAGVKGGSKAVMKSVAKTAIEVVRDYVGARDGHPKGENRLVADDLGKTPADLEQLIDAIKEDGAFKKSPGPAAAAVRFARTWLTARRDNDGLGEEFCAAVGEAVRRDGRSLPDIVEGTGITAASLENWVRGQSYPSTANRERLPLLEASLGLKPAGRLTRTLEKDGAGWRTGVREGRVLGPKMRKYAADNWRTMDEPEFLAMVDFIRTRLMHRDTAYGASQREAAARRVDDAIKRQELGEELAGLSDRMQAELDYLFTHMTLPYNTDLHRRPGVLWEPGSTGPYKIWYITDFLKWQIKSVDEGGLGRDPAHLTLADLVHAPLVFAYIDHRAGRLADVEWEDRKRGKVITPAEVGFLQIAAGLIDDEYGFVTQQHDLAARIVPDARKLPAFAYVDHRGRRVRDEIDGEENPTDSGIDIMPASLADLNESEFLKELRRAELRYRQGVGDLELIADSIRDPMEPIDALLNHDSPQETLMRMLKLAGERQPSRRHPLQFHLHRRDVMTNIIFAVTSLRSSNVSEILSEGPEANLVWDAAVSKWLLKIHWKQFKNYKSALIFGRKFKREWYRNYLPDVLGLYEHIEQYLAESRPWFLDRMDAREPGRAAPDQLILTSHGNALDRSTMWRLVFDFTALHVAGNPYRNTGVINCQPFGPHCYRDLRATDILKNPTPGEDPYYEGAIALQTSPRMIHDHYGRVKSEDRNKAVQARLLDIDARLKRLMAA